MDCNIVNKEAFTVVARSRVFRYEDAMARIPGFWEEHYRTGGGSVICGMYGICLEEGGPEGSFEYLIADDLDPSREVPEGFVTRTIPPFTWAVFPCVGKMPQALQDLNRRIFSQWLPENGEYQMAAGINVEMYSDPGQFEKGTQDDRYYSEIWIPVKKA